MKQSAWRCFMLLGLLGLTACGGEVEPEREPTKVEVYMLDIDAVARGEAIFAGSCATYCHTLEPSDTDASFLFDCEWQHGGGEQEIYDVIAKGIADTRMVGFGNNFPEGEEDLWRVMAYLRSNQQQCVDAGADVSVAE